MCPQFTAPSHPCIYLRPSICYPNIRQKPQQLNRTWHLQKAGDNSREHAISLDHTAVDLQAFFKSAHVLCLQKSVGTADI